MAQRRLAEVCRVPMIAVCPWFERRGQRADIIRHTKNTKTMKLMLCIQNDGVAGAGLPAGERVIVGIDTSGRATACFGHPVTTDPAGRVATLETMIRGAITKLERLAKGLTSKQPDLALDVQNVASELKLEVTG